MFQSLIALLDWFLYVGFFSFILGVLIGATRKTQPDNNLNYNNKSHRQSSSHPAIPSTTTTSFPLSESGSHLHPSPLQSPLSSSSYFSVDGRSSLMDTSSHVRKAKITSSPWVDVEAKKVLDLFFKDFVDNWYYYVIEHRGLNNWMRRLVINIIQDLEKRVNRVDLLDLVLNDVVYIIVAHMRDVKVAKEKQGTTQSGGLDVNQLFERIQPHFALTSKKHQEVIWEKKKKERKKEKREKKKK